MLRQISNNTIFKITRYNWLSRFLVYYQITPLTLRFSAYTLMRYVDCRCYIASNINKNLHLHENRAQLGNCNNWCNLIIPSYLSVREYCTPKIPFMWNLLLPMPLHFWGIISVLVIPPTYLHWDFRKFWHYLVWGEGFFTL